MNICWDKIIEIILKFGPILLTALIRIIEFILRKIKKYDRHDPSLLQPIRKKISRYQDDPKNLTKKQIKNVIEYYDPVVIKSSTMNRLEQIMSRWGLIRNQRDLILGTNLSFNWKRFFVESESTFKESIANELSNLYKNSNIKCFVTIPFPHDKHKNKSSNAFELALIDRLGGQIYRDFLTIAVLKKNIPKGWVRKINEGENILIIQQIAANDDFLSKVIKFIEGISSGNIIEVLTLVDPSNRIVESTVNDIPERILIKLSLNLII